MKKIQKPLLGLLCGAALGVLIMWLLDDKQAVEDSSEAMNYGKLVLAIVMTLSFLALSIIIHIILHEAGHLIMGLLTGYKFLMFRAFHLTLVKTDEGLKWKRFFIQGTAGQCLLDLPEDQDMQQVPWFWYNAGGVLMNLLLSVIGILAISCFHLSVLPQSFFIILAFVGVAIALLNGIPLMAGGVSNDGNNILMLWRQPELRVIMAHSLQIVGMISRGKRLQEMPTEWFASNPVNTQSNYLDINARINHMSWLEDQGKLDEAREVAEEIMAIGKKLPLLFFNEVCGERVMLELLTTNRPEVVEQLWTKQLAQYTESNSKYSPIKNAILFTYELLYQHHAEQASPYKQHLLQHQHDYTMPGEALTALYLIELAEEQYNKDFNKE